MKLPRLVVCGLALACAAAPLLRAQEPRLANLSTRAQAGTGDATLTAGFVVGPGSPDKRVLVRAIGPSLSAFGLSGLLADPRLTLVNSTGGTVATNDNWATPVGTGAASQATLTTTFAETGAFNLTSTSRDAALLLTLPPGSYTAQVNGVNNTSGLALVEVYEVGNTGAKLTNLSTRAQVGTGANVMIPGIVVSGNAASRRFLVRAAGPALTPFGLTGTLADPVITVTRNVGTSTTVVATNDNWSSPSDGNAAPASSLTTAFLNYGAFAFAAGSRDAALLVDLGPGNYGIQVSGAGGTSGLAIVEVYDTTPATPTTVTISATDASADETGNNPGEYLLTRSGGDLLAPLVVNYGVGGSAVNGSDYLFLPGTVTIPAGATTVRLPLLPNPDLQNDPTDTVVVSLSQGINYTAGAQSSAIVTIANSEATLYTAPVRTTATASSSTAYGFATIMLSASGTLAAVNVSFSNLSSAQVTAHLTYGTTEDYVMNLPNGQVAGAQWFFTPTGQYSQTQLLDALRSGNISVRIDSASFPGGELKGTFIQTAGSTTFTAPPAPPAVSLTNLSATEAARLLTQGTFGPTKAEIDTLTGGSVTAWLDAQIARPTTSHRTATQEDRTTFGGSGSYTNWNAIHPPNRQSAWFKTSLTAPDQLRQRVAFALSQLLVVSDISLGGDNQTEPLAHYYDLLVNGAFGNYRTLLENVSLNPMMAEYLSSLRNNKADPVTGQTPDENYAREVMQLFTIGLNLLQPDGTLVLGPDGLPIPTYNQTTITEMAKVFTGWAYFGATTFRGNGPAATALFNSMIQFAASHDTTAKNLSPVSSTVIPANQTGQQDLTAALDALYNHQNTAPLVSRHLIQRLVTSNPSPAYVYRVAQVFTQQKTSPSQLASVVRAIFTDYEARSSAVVANQSFGKLKEPLLRLTGLLRSFGASSQSGRYLGYRVVLTDGTFLTSGVPLPPVANRVPNAGGATNVSSGPQLQNVQGSLAQAALRAPTVFNFYHPDYVLPGDLARAGLVTPEFEITDDNFAITVPNFLRNFVIATVPTTTAAPYAITLNTTYEQSLVASPSALLDHLNLLLCAGNMPAATKTRITAAMTSLAANTSALDRINTAILVALTSPAAAIQK